MSSLENIKFLLVDDLDENLLALEALLRRDGLELIKARSGAEALELLLVHDFALALLDHRFGVMFLIGCVIVSALLIYEHLTVARWGTTKIALAFFTLNGVISCVLGVLGMIDLIAL